jgi:L-alanine-DL-glutamate epimerase-like enolase superfamily enzyme
MKLELRTERWPFKVPFRTARGASVALEVIVVTLTDARGHIGRGEAAGVDYAQETVASMTAAIEALRMRIEAGIDRAELALALPPGGARNALDCALWDLEAKQSGVPVARRAGFPGQGPVTTCFTFGIDSDAATAQLAAQYRDWPLLKLKLDAERHVGVVRLVRELCPATGIIVDANQGWTCELLNELAPELEALGVKMIEQPVPTGADETLRGYRGRIRLGADESCVDQGSLAALAGLYQVVNVKLDKTGGLTEALALAHAARAAGFAVMVGNMAGTSLAMAPGMIVAQLAEFVDLDGPLLHLSDRVPGIAYDRGRMTPPPRELWG